MRSAVKPPHLGPQSTGGWPWNRSWEMLGTSNSDATAFPSLFRHLLDASGKVLENVTIRNLEGKSSRKLALRPDGTASETQGPDPAAHLGRILGMGLYMNRLNHPRKLVMKSTRQSEFLSLKHHNLIYNFTTYLFEVLGLGHWHSQRTMWPFLGFQILLTGSRCRCGIHDLPGSECRKTRCWKCNPPTRIHPRVASKTPREELEREKIYVHISYIIQL